MIRSSPEPEDMHPYSCNTCLACGKTWNLYHSMKSPMSTEPMFTFPPQRQSNNDAPLP